MRGSADVHPTAAYHTALPAVPGDDGWDAAAPTVFTQSFRTDLAASGFALLTFLAPPNSSTLRRAMIRLKEVLGVIFLRATGRYLVYKSMARFDQQVTTKFHLDGAPPESLLMLGYEPSAVESRLAMADYTRAAWDMGIEPVRFVAEHNPMFTGGARLLERYTTPLTAFDPTLAHILLVNNSCLPYDPAGHNLLGVMHQATVPHPDASRRRIVNSTMLVGAVDPAEEEVGPERQRDFITTSHVSGRDSEAREPYGEPGA
jgi:hypothetical protein